jgi:hypothetical protein
MKTFNILIVIISIFVSYNSSSFSQNLDLLPQHQRDSILIAISKETVLKYGPGYYRDNIKPTIERGQVPKEGHRGGKDANRVYYWVTYYYDPKIESLECNYTSAIAILADSRKPVIVQFGNGYVRIIPENGLRKGEEIIQVPYDTRKSLIVIPKKENN